MAGCADNKQPADDLITVDVTASYPQKELVLQDFMDVEYVPLETTDEFVCQGFVMAAGKDLVVTKNYTNDGDIFLFDRAGKAVRKINRKGQGGEEYANVLGILLDEERGELFVCDLNKIKVYDLDGLFKRSFNYEEGSRYANLYNLDRDHFICYKSVAVAGNGQESHLIISKQDGRIVREVQIPYAELETLTWSKDGVVVTPALNQIAFYRDNWVLANVSSDTIYSYLPDGEINPFIARTPSIHTMDPEVFLIPTLLTDRYYFMSALKKELDLKTFKFPTAHWVYDKKEKALFESIVYNGDYLDNTLYVVGQGSLNREIVSWWPIEASTLVEAYEKGELKGKLKEIAATLDEESNPVIMLVKNKR
jgi:hypothetical protein